MTSIEPRTVKPVWSGQYGRRTVVSEPIIHHLAPELAKDMKRRIAEGPESPIVKGSYALNAGAFDGQLDEIRAARQAVVAALDASRNSDSTLPPA